MNRLVALFACLCTGCVTTISGDNPVSGDNPELYAGEKIYKVLRFFNINQIRLMMMDFNKSPIGEGDLLLSIIISEGATEDFQSDTHTMYIIDEGKESKQSLKGVIFFNDSNPQEFSDKYDQVEQTEQLIYYLTEDLFTNLSSHFDVKMWPPDIYQPKLKPPPQPRRAPRPPQDVIVTTCGLFLS